MIARLLYNKDIISSQLFDSNVSENILLNSINNQLTTRPTNIEEDITWITNPLASEHYYRHIQMFRPVLNELDNGTW